MIALILYRKNGHFLRVKGVRSSVDQTPLNTANVRASLKYGSTALPECNALQLLPITGADGDYEGIIAASAAPRAGLKYLCTVDITYPGLEPAHAEIPCSVQDRGI